MVKKGLKVTNISREKKIGIAAENLNEFLKKSCEKLMVEDTWQACKCYVAEDGTLVDDDEYFSTLPAQTLLVVVKPEEQMKTDFEHMYDLIRSTKQGYLHVGNQAQDFLCNDAKLRKIQECIAKDIQNKIIASLKAEDPDWFEGIDTNEKTKEAFMKRRAKERMRGYYYKTKQMLITSKVYANSAKNHSKEHLDLFIKNLQKLLEINEYNCYYFDRSAKEWQKLCNDTGLFECGGVWNKDKCKYLYEHLINPYRSREERILFQTWNLDHRIELSRSIIPSILEAVKQVNRPAEDCYNCRVKVTKGRLSAIRYFNEIFTTDNLKLVHIVCHDKGQHTEHSNIYIVCEKCCKNEIPN